MRPRGNPDWQESPNMGIKDLKEVKDSVQKVFNIPLERVNDGLAQG